MRRRNGPAGNGLRLPRGSSWVAAPSPSADAFLAALAPLLPANSVLCIEGTAVSPEARSLFLRHRPTKTQTQKVEPDILEPRSQQFHVDATASSLSQISRFIRDNPSARWGHHIKVYDSEGLLVDWHDADTGWFLHLSSAFPSESTRKLGDALGCTFSLEPGA